MLNKINSLQSFSFVLNADAKVICIVNVCVSIVCVNAEEENRTPVVTVCNPYNRS